MNRGRPVTLQAVAAAAGCAKSTVSMALRDDHRIPIATRQRIRAAADRLGYHPNPLLASLASRRFHVAKVLAGAPVGFITHGWPEPEKTVWVDGLKNSARTHGYDLFEYPLAELREMKNPARVLHMRGVQGLVLPAHVELEMPPDFDRSLFSVVGLGYRRGTWLKAGEADFHRVTSDHYEAVLKAWSEARHAGYRRIGFALHFHHRFPRDDVLRRTAVEFCEQTVPKRDRIPPLWTEFGVPLDLAGWLAKHRPDAVIGMHPGIYWDLLNAGWRSPRDGGFVSLDTIEGSLGKDELAITGIKETVQDECSAAMQLLDEEIRLRYRGQNPSPRTILLHGIWIPGATLPCRS